MRAIFLVVATIAVLVNARPDLTIGYNPNAPKDNYDGPTPDHDAFGVRSNVNLVSGLGDASSTSIYQIGQTQGHSGGLFGASAGGYKFGPEGGYQAASSGASSYSATTGTDKSTENLPPLSSFGAPGATVQTTTGSIGYTNGDSSVQTNVGTSKGAEQNAFSTVALSSVHPTQSQVSSTQSGSVSSYSSGSTASFGQQSTLPPIITKSFFFESAPEEPEENEGPRYVHVGRAQKNYKVIFIKAPSYGLNSQVIPIVPPNEDKTIIYVLSKKPEFNQDIELPPVPTTEATKPDVFFIKYKSDKEAADAQHKIQTVYETNTNVEGDARFDDGHLQSIANAAVPNIVSASGSAGSDAPYTTSTHDILSTSVVQPSVQSPSLASYESGGSSATDAASSATSQQSGFTVLSGTNNKEYEGLNELHGVGQETSIANTHETSALEPEHIPPGGYHY